MISGLLEKETHKLFGISSGGIKAADEKVKWAMLIIESNIDINIDDVATLAMLTEPYNEFEANQYFDNALKELNIIKPDDEKAELCICSSTRNTRR